MIVSTKIEQPEDMDQKDVPSCIINVKVKEDNLPAEQPDQETEAVPESQASDKLDQETWLCRTHMVEN